MRLEEVIQQPGIKERLLKQDILKSINVAIAGEIEQYYPETRTAVIQPVIREWNCKENPPLLLDVPVFFWGNYTFTPKKGDGCLVVCADSCIDAWFQNGGVSSPVVARTHSLSDGFAFVGFRQTGGVDLPATLKKMREDIDAASQGGESKKDKQDPVNDPTASGTGISFIDSISQNANGVITVTKKTVSGVSKEGAGLCPALPNESGTEKFLRQDGSWAVPPDDDTQYSAGTGLALDAQTNTFSLENSGVTAGTYGPTANVTGNEGNTIKVCQIKVDDYGRVTEITERTYTSKNTDSWRPYVVKSYSAAWSSLAADTALEVTGSQLKDSNGAVVSTPSGYTPVAVLEAYTGHTQVQLVGFRCNVTGSNWMIRGRNTSTGSKSGTATLSILYVKTGSP